jgi:hypothetical protein
VKWKPDKSGYKPEVVIARIRDSRKIEANGSVSFTDIRLTQYIAILASMLDVGDISDTDAYVLVRKAIFAAAKTEPFDGDAVIREARSQLTAYYKQAPVTYCLATSLSAKWASWPKAMKVGASIVQYGVRASRLRKAHREILDQAQHLYLSDLPRDYVSVLVRCSGRSPGDAAETGLRAIERLRAIWNFMLNSGQSMRMSTGRRQPVNRILMGPVHTLHELNGSSAYDGWWYDPQYSGAVRLYDFREMGARLIRFQRRVTRLIEQHPYGKVLEACLIRYSRALDLRDWESAYLQLWAVLEQLTSTGQDGYGVTVRRASFLHGDGEYARQELLHLRDRRNRTVHEGKEHRDLETLVYQLKHYVEGLFWFHLNNGNRFTTIQDAAAFMDLPWEKAELVKRRRAISFALAFRSVVPEKLGVKQEAKSG